MHKYFRGHIEELLKVRPKIDAPHYTQWCRDVEAVANTLSKFHPRFNRIRFYAQLNEIDK